MSQRIDVFGDVFNEAMKLRDEGKFDEAVTLLLSLIQDRVDKRSYLVAVHCQLGNIYTYHLGRPDLGEKYFRKAIMLKPSSELSSLGLFHSLMSQRKVDDALEEAKRFISKYPSEEYAQTIREIVAGLDDE